MAQPSKFESDMFEPAFAWGIVSKIAGGVLTVLGFFTFFIGFRIDGASYFGLMPGLSFGLPGLTLLGIGYLLHAAAAIGELLLASRKS